MLIGKSFPIVIIDLIKIGWGAKGMWLLKCKEGVEIEKSLELDKAIKQFLAKYLSPQTKRAYLGDILGFFSRVGTVNISDVTQEEIGRYRDKLLCEKEPATVARKLTALCQFLSSCSKIECLE